MVHNLHYDFKFGRLKKRDKYNDTQILVILDLNGTLIDRRKQKIYKKRNHMDRFIEFLWRHPQFRVAVWTSAMKHNVVPILNKLFYKKRLEFFLDRNDVCIKDTGKNSKQWDSIKDLQYVWRKSGKWDRHNTIIIDDSPSKTRLNPLNSINLSSCKDLYCKESHRKEDAKKTEFVKDDELLRLIGYLQDLASNFKTLQSVQKYIQFRSYTN